MLFSSIPFLYYFLPLVILIYFLTPIKNTVILLSSLVFYAWGEPKYVFLMILTVLINYILGLLIEKFRYKTLSKIFVVMSVVVSLGLLAYFKYADFFIENFVALTGMSAELLNIALPIGISFYTFQILSYTIDVYRGTVSAQKNPITLGAYISMFPQLIAGPIVRYSDVEIQLKSRTHSFEKAATGIRRFVIGLSKKILIANTLGELCEVFHTTTDNSVMFYWLYALAFALQIYFDFSGYSDMAIGLGKIFGFDFIENFRYPFISKSITEFWRRWHISLGSWFRDYVYIPMGGNRAGKARLLVNIFVVWFLTGFWHGAEWNFIVWGLYFAVLLLAEKLFLSRLIEKSRLFGHIYVIFFIIISFVIFSASGMREAVSYIGGMFGMKDIPFISETFLYNLKNYGFVIIIAIFASTPVGSLVNKKLLSNDKVKTIYELAQMLVLVVLLVVSTGYLVDGSFNPFLYFRF